MKRGLFFLFLTFSITLFAQKDSLQLEERYWEDQLYLSVTYNVLNEQPSDAGDSGFSYGLAVGYIKDIPFNKKGKWALGLGVGYGYGSFNHSLIVDENGSLSISDEVSANKVTLHNIEFPIQFRWRNSTGVTYSFWRVYAGVRLSYNLNNTFSYTLNEQRFSFSNINLYNKFQTGLELSVGYDAFNFYVYYGWGKMYKNVSIGSELVNTRISKFGLIFYFL